MLLRSSLTSDAWRHCKRVVELGKFDIMVGASSTDIRQRATLEVAKK